MPKPVQLLKDNKDCFHCCRDHLSADCPKKERLCGGGKSDRECTRSHAIYKLFCADKRREFLQPLVSILIQLQMMINKKV